MPFSPFAKGESERDLKSEFSSADIPFAKKKGGALLLSIYRFLVTSYQFLNLI
jgi:hypothetical protein